MQPMTTKQLHDPRMIQARQALIRGQPFFGALTMFLTLVNDPSCGTMATDGDKLFYNPEWLNELSALEIEGVLAHEVLHCAYRHHTRRNSRDPSLWNMACDYVINPDVLAAGYKLPKGGLLDPRFSGMSAGQVYAILQREQPPQQQNGGSSRSPASGPGQAGSKGPGEPGNRPGRGRQYGQDPSNWGAVLDAPEPGMAAKAEAEAEWETRVRQAVTAATKANAGHIPGELRRLVEDIRAPRVNWRHELRRFIDDRVRVQYAWTRPNKRLLEAGFVMPGAISDGINRLGVALDTSGSISAAALAQFAGELQAIMDEGAVGEVIVCYCDAAVNDVAIFHQGEDIRLDSKGGGGTRFSPAIKYFVDRGDEIGALLYFTDMCCHDFGPEPEFPVMWIGYGLERSVTQLAERRPFGEFVFIDPEE